MSNGNASRSVSGNAGTDRAANFIGTTNNQPFIFKTNGIEAMYIAPERMQQVNGFIRGGGNVGIGTVQPEAKLHVSGPRTFEHPQVQITQTTPFEFARLRFFTFGCELVQGARATHFWDVAAADRLNIFSERVGNVMTLWGVFDQHANAFVPRVGIGNENPASTLDVNGTATVKILEITGGSDVAEPVQAKESEVEAGTVMVIDEANPGQVRVSDRAYDSKVAGIVSGAGGLRPGLMLGQQGGADASTLLALTGRVYCKAEAFSGPIEPGDLLTTSALRGHAMKAIESRSSNGAIIGKAMGSLKDGTGLLLVLVSLQ
jgi:hypothetical protein